MPQCRIILNLLSFVWVEAKECFGLTFWDRKGWKSANFFYSLRVPWTQKGWTTLCLGFASLIIRYEDQLLDKKTSINSIQLFIIEKKQFWLNYMTLVKECFLCFSMFCLVLLTKRNFKKLRLFFRMRLKNCVLGFFQIFSIEIFSHKNKYFAGE